MTSIRQGSNLRSELTRVYFVTVYQVYFDSLRFQVFYFSILSTDSDQIAKSINRRLTSELTAKYATERRRCEQRSLIWGDTGRSTCIAT